MRAPIGGRRRAGIDTQLTARRNHRASRRISWDFGINTWRSSQDGLPTGQFEDHPSVGMAADLVGAVVKAAVMEVAERDQVG